MERNKLYDWLLRFLKGIFIGSGFILPGVSGGVLAAVFGIYEKIIEFLANITKNFKENFIFFLPVGLGGVFGVFVFSFALSFFFEKYEIKLLWFFIGCIVGTLPTLIKQAAKNGRKLIHLVIAGVSAVVALIFLINADTLISGSLPQNFLTWTFAGCLIALGTLVPGLSSSNLLLFLDMYKPMTDGISSLDFSVIIPLGIGGFLTLISFSKLVNFILKKAYTTFFHVILGIVIASTILIIPTNYNYLSFGGVICVISCVLGVCLSTWMSSLEEKFKPE